MIVASCNPEGPGALSPNTLLHDALHGVVMGSKSVSNKPTCPQGAVVMRVEIKWTYPATGWLAYPFDVYFLCSPQ